MQIVKIVITGHVNSGKTELIRTISEIDVVSTEAVVSDRIRAIKETTTVAMDFGRLTIDNDLTLHLYGTPRQERFDFMWDILSEGMLGFIVLVDATDPATFVTAEKIINYFYALQDCPFIVAANKQDLEDAWDVEAIKFILHLNSGIPIVPCRAKEKESVKNVLLTFLEHLISVDSIDKG
jgi:small GTP-binding protein